MSPVSTADRSVMLAVPMGQPIDWATRLVLDDANIVPLYHQLKERLRVVAQDMEPDSLMPSEKELMEYAHVSRATARKAVSDLVHEGVLYAQRGRGTFTAPPRVATKLSRPAGFTETMRRLGRTPGTRLISVQDFPADEHLAGRLALTPGDPVTVVERLRLLDGEPCMVERAHLSSRLAPGLAGLDLTRSLYELLDEVYGKTPARGTETILAVSADAALARLLAVPRRSALLATARSTETDAGVPLEFTLRHARGDRCSFLVELTQASTLTDTSVADRLLRGRKG